MNNRQRKFADEYLIDRNATRAYKTAYQVKKDKSAAVGGSRLLREPEVSQYIDGQLALISSGAIAKAEEIMSFFTAVLRGEQGPSGKKPTVYEQIMAAERLSKLIGADKSPNIPIVAPVLVDIRPEDPVEVIDITPVES